MRHRERRFDPPTFWPTEVSWRWFEDLFRDPDGRQMIKVEEFTENGTFVVRAELPGIDPDKDVEVTVDDGVLHITAKRSEEEEKTERDFHRRELRYGSFTRVLSLPEGVDEASVVASYKDGILEVRLPMPATPEREPARRIAIGHG
jgi:HSP20 family protein